MHAADQPLTHDVTQPPEPPAGADASPTAGAPAARRPATGAATTPRRGGLAALTARFEHLVRELGKFGIVGFASYLVDVGVFNLCRLGAGLDPISSKVISVAIAATVAFLGNRFWTWRHRARSGLGREYAIYFLFNAIGLAIAIGCLLLTHYVLGAQWPVMRSALADNISSNVVGMALGTFFRFWAYRTYVFRDPAEAEEV